MLGAPVSLSYSPEKYVSDRILTTSLQDLAKMDDIKLRTLIPYEITDFLFVPVTEFAKYQLAANFLASQANKEMEIFLPAECPNVLTEELISELKLVQNLKNDCQEEISILAPIINDCLTLCAKLSNQKGVRVRMEINKPTHLNNRTAHYDGELHEQNRYLILFIPAGPQTQITPEYNVIKRIPPSLSSRYLSLPCLTDPDLFLPIPEGYAAILRMGQLATVHKAAPYNGKSSGINRFFLACMSERD